ncbi:BnaA06g33930D [Brassica napus]|uniref:(rape) hypothetical protein n=1 Tax=Brassica napus TaxID=3708 RepID=A0A078I6Z6_BRANA|nr:unnamed protein product [Brassica napus]CDY45189.1 BnaA06g33930D [Brassica napus]
MVILTPSPSSTPKTSFDFTKNTNNHSLSVSVPSSSSYLRSKEEAVTTTMKLIEPCEPLNMTKEVQELGDKTNKVMKAPEDPEIGVFGAEKYFNGDMDSDQSSSVLSLTNTEVERFVVESKQSEKRSTGTPSVRSDSSWNSRSILLQNKLVNSCNSSLQEKKHNSDHIPKVNNSKKSFISNLRCKCVCTDGNSVDVDDKISVKIQKQEELVQRKAPEVFGSPLNIEKRVFVQKKLTVPQWESRIEEEDTKSDSSSDLFEIENLTGKPKPILARQGSDPASPTCYAPSEVSIEWSIVTASAADFSVMSECATSPVRRNRSSQVPQIPTNTYIDKNAPQRQKSSSSGRVGFLSCKSHKSVMVSGDSDRRSSMNKTSMSYVPRFPMETTKPKSFETRRRVSNSSIAHTPSSLLYSQY